METSTHARAQVVLEFSVPGGGWGDTCDLAQVYRQARESAEEVLKQKLLTAIPGMRILSTTITAVLVEEKR